MQLLSGLQSNAEKIQFWQDSHLCNREDSCLKTHIINNNNNKKQLLAHGDYRKREHRKQQSSSTILPREYILTLFKVCLKTCCFIPIAQEEITSKSSHISTYFTTWRTGLNGLPSLSQVIKDLVLSDESVSSSGRCVW